MMWRSRLTGVYSGECAYMEPASCRVMWMWAQSEYLQAAGRAGYWRACRYKATLGNSPQAARTCRAKFFSHRRWVVLGQLRVGRASLYTLLARCTKSTRHEGYRADNPSKHWPSGAVFSVREWCLLFWDGLRPQINIPKSNRAPCAY